MHLHLSHLLLLCLSIVVPAQSEPFVSRQSCQSGYQQCSPAGATEQSIPPIGTGITGLYQDLVETVDSEPSKSARNANLSPVAPANAVCCAATTQCLLLESFLVAFCWDRFTTNFFLPDGSYGNIVSGNYVSAQGGTANLITGNYTLSNSQTGNIYGSAPSAKPNTATLAIPTPWTSSGIGTAISASRVGQLETYTTTIPGTVIAPSAVPAATITPSNGNVTIVSASTIPGTSLPPVTSTMTTAGSGVTPTGSSMGRNSSGDLQMEMVFITFLLSFLVLLI